MVSLLKISIIIFFFWINSEKNILNGFSTNIKFLCFLFPFRQGIVRVAMLTWTATPSTLSPGTTTEWWSSATVSPWDHFVFCDKAGTWQIHCIPATGTTTRSGNCKGRCSRRRSNRYPGRTGLGQGGVWVGFWWWLLIYIWSWSVNFHKLLWLLSLLRLLWLFMHIDVAVASIFLPTL